MNVNVLARLEGADELRKRLKELGKGALVQAVRPHIKAEAQALKTAASVGEPRGVTGALGESKRVVELRGRGAVRFAVVYLNYYAKWVHEGIFGHAKVGARYGRFKWFERAVQAFEAGYIERTGAKLWKLVEREVKR